MARKSEIPVDLTDEQRKFLEQLVRVRTAEHRRVVRARALLWAAEGRQDVEIAEMAGVTARTVANWRLDFRKRGTECLVDRKRSGRKGSFPP